MFVLWCSRSKMFNMTVLDLKNKEPIIFINSYNQHLLLALGNFPHWKVQR